MRTREELVAGCAQLLKDLREKKGLSKLKMANLMYIDDHTWARYEKGESSPSVPDFIWMFDQLGEDALRTVLDYLYPSTYKNIGQESDDKKLREAAAHYFMNVASEQNVREWDYLVFGNHGSNIQAQMEMFTMIDHLPMLYRYAIAEMVDMFYELAKAKGELVKPDQAMPDVSIFRDGLQKGKEASYEGRNSYTTSSTVKK